MFPNALSHLRCSSCLLSNKQIFILHKSNFLSNSSTFYVYGNTSVNIALFSARKEFLAVHCFLSLSFFLFIYCSELILMMWRGRSSPEDTRAGELVHAAPFHLFPCPFVSAFAILPPNKIKQNLRGKEKREKEKLNLILKTLV